MQKFDYIKIFLF